MTLLTSVASEVDAIRDGYVVTDHNLIHAQVIQITLHPDKAPTPYPKAAQPIQCDPYRCQHTVRRNVLANALTRQVPHLPHQRPLIPIRHVLSLRFGMTKAVEKGQNYPPPDKIFLFTLSFTIMQPSLCDSRYFLSNQNLIILDINGVLHTDIRLLDYQLFQFHNGG